ncbi:hypothetical protein SAMN04488029_3992 [Reichenbachiella faecimaris]|uniref:Tetratricopeptide repeat-containing protein n=1 Tax=Reichenbachiella faecimaris TaxID=692418 RepID=A0A1W2GRW0_REIFA|nr:hypothetical protein [Reichenbachiella faecimaris]SMD38996.1 hypothetical protein SAMN04488029_3992 [Reichenbachiella faecimaris]
MKKTTSAILTLFLLFQFALSFAQTANFEKGLEAIEANRLHEAMICFTKVVEGEKYEVSGKDLSIAYAYLAMMRTAYLKKDLEDSDFNNIITKQGHIQTTIHEMVRAVQFQTNSSKSMITGPKETLIELSTSALQVIGDSLLTYDETQPNSTTTYLANFAIGQFGELENIAVDNWQIHDILGLAHYYLGDKNKAMAEFDQGRAQFSALGDQPTSQLHLKNYILSGQYYFTEETKSKEAYKVSKDGSAYTSILINGLGDDQMKEILRLNKIENRFRQYMSRIDDSGK